MTEFINHETHTVAVMVPAYTDDSVMVVYRPVLNAELDSLHAVTYSSFKSAYNALRRSGFEVSKNYI